MLFISLCSINMSNNMIRLNRYCTIFKVYICNRSATPANTHLADLSRVLKLKVQIYVGPEIMTMDYLSIYMRHFSIERCLEPFRRIYCHNHYKCKYFQRYLEFVCIIENSNYWRSSQYVLLKGYRHCSTEKCSM